MCGGGDFTLRMRRVGRMRRGGAPQALLHRIAAGDRNRPQNQPWEEITILGLGRHFPCRETFQNSALSFIVEHLGILLEKHFQIRVSI